MPKETIVANLPRSSAILTAGISFCISCLLFIAGCSSTQPPAAPDTRAADEAAVRNADTNWSAAAQSKSPDAWMAFYADETVILPPNDKLTSGKENIRKVVTDMFAMPGFALSWQPTKVEIARSGDLAYSYGTYQATFNDPKGKPVTDQGKYAEVWKKQPDGGWKCVLDTWSSDLPATPPSK